MTDLKSLEQALSSRHRVFTYLGAGKFPATLFAALSQELPHIEPSSWPQRAAWGGVYLNGKLCVEDHPLAAPCRIEYFEPKYDISRAREVFSGLKPEHIIFEDDDLLAVFKPAGLPCLSTREQLSHNLKTYLHDYARRFDPAATVHLPSRLDASASGLVAASKSQRMHAALQRLFEKRRISKLYLLEVPGVFEWQELRVDKPIGRDKRHAILRKITQDGGKDAVTTFRALCRSQYLDPSGRRVETTILEASPLTGRTHQIRVHAAAAAAPILGDGFYGGAQADSLHLLSYRLGFTHPLERRAVEIKLPATLLPAWVPGEEF